MTPAKDHAITSEELAQLPFGFENPHWIQQDPPYSDIVEATWNSLLVWSSTPARPWHWDSNSEEITSNDWELFYPGYQKIDITVCTLLELSGSYHDKSVKYNSNLGRWEYLNHKPVNFTTSESDNPNVTEVSALLDSAITLISRSRSALTLEQQKQSL
jgi:hypothetical protein